MSEAPTLDKRQARLRDLRDRLAEREDIDFAEVDTSRYPERLHVTIADTAITDGVHDVLADAGAVIEHAVADPPVTHDGDDTHLTLTLTVPEPWRDAGRRTVRSWGESSFALTFPHEAVSLADLDVGTSVDVDARDGEIRLSKVADE